MKHLRICAVCREPVAGPCARCVAPDASSLNRTPTPSIWPDVLTWCAIVAGGAYGAALWLGDLAR